MNPKSAKSLQSCLTLCDPMDCSPPGSSVHGIFQARTPEWVAISFSRGSSWTRDQTSISYILCLGRQVLYHWATREGPDSTHNPFMLWSTCKSTQVIWYYGKSGKQNSWNLFFTLAYRLYIAKYTYFASSITKVNLVADTFLKSFVITNSLQIKSWIHLRS